MKKSNVAVMLLDLSGEYTLELLAGIKSFFHGKNVNIILSQVKLPDLPYGCFDYQYWSAVKLLESDSIDGVIVVSSFFVSSIPVQKFTKLIQGLSKKPIVSIGTDLKFSKSCSLKTECESVYDNLIKHLKEKHNCKNIAFMSANDTVSEEAKERYEAFKSAMNKNKVPFDENLVFNGNFTISSGERALIDFKSKEEIPFDAIVCANDLMAIGVFNQLSRLNVSIPEDVIVTGFDNSYQARAIEPTFTTISTQIFTQGVSAAELLFDKMNGKKVSKQNFIPLENFYRQSCGCVSKTDIKTDYFLDKGKSVLRNNLVRSESLDSYIKYSSERRNIYYLLDLIQISETLTDLFTRMNQILFSVDIRRMAVCLFDEPIENEKGQVMELPKEVELAMVLDREHNKELINPKIRFNPAKTILPDDIFDDDYSDYVMEPIFYGEKQYGYFILRFIEKNDFQNLIYIKTLSLAISSSYEYTRKQKENMRLLKLNEDLTEDNNKLSKTSKTDELTQVFNRRGFMFAGKQIISVSHSLIKKGAIFFCDMDGLKTINDTYGHKMGDEAIKTVAEALKKTFNVNDVIGRLGGDEFAIVSGFATTEDFDDKYHAVLKACKTIASSKKLPFEITVSMGVVEFSQKENNLETLLAQADKKQYELKKKKKALKV